MVFLEGVFSRSTGLNESSNGGWWSVRLTSKQQKNFPYRNLRFPHTSYLNPTSVQLEPIAHKSRVSFEHLITFTKSIFSCTQHFFMQYGVLYVLLEHFRMYVLRVENDVLNYTLRIFLKFILFSKFHYRKFRFRRTIYFLQYTIAQNYLCRL